MHSELCASVQLYDRRLPPVGRPKIIGFMSLDHERRFSTSIQQLKFINNADVSNRTVSFDLNKNLHLARHRSIEHMDEKINNLLYFLLEHRKRLNFSTTHNLEKARFYCYRGLLTCIACTPYENQESWRIVATLYKGDVYLCALDTDEKIKKRNNMTENEKKFSSWGYKFEQYLLSGAPNSKPNPDVPVDENEEFSLMYSSTLNKHSIVYGAEMDGIRCAYSEMELPDPRSSVDNIIGYLSNKLFMELKTNRHIESTKQQTNFRRYKTKKWWCQSFFGGVEAILCGFRNDDGIVEELKVFNLRDLVKMSERFWSPNVCLNFLDDFLTYVKRCLAKEIRMKHGENGLNNLQSLPLIYLHFEWNPRRSVRVTNNYDIETDPILPQWFLDKDSAQNRSDV